MLMDMPKIWKDSEPQVGPVAYEDINTPDLLDNSINEIIQKNRLVIIGYYTDQVPNIFIEKAQMELLPCKICGDDPKLIEWFDEGNRKGVMIDHVCNKDILYDLEDYPAINLRLAFPKDGITDFEAFLQTLVKAWNKLNQQDVQE